MHTEAAVAPPGADAAATRGESRFHRIALAPFVAVLYAYCAGGPFGFEAMVSSSGPGLTLIFLLVIPMLFSVPVALVTAELASAMPVQGGFYRWTRAAFGDFWGFQCGWWNWTGTFLMSAAYGVMLADYASHLLPGISRAQHWSIAFLFLATVAWLNIRGIKLVGNLTLLLLLLALIPVAIFTISGFAAARFNPLSPLFPPDRPWGEAFGVGLALGLWIYSGYEQLSTVTEEVEDPARNFPRGLAIVVPLAIVSFLLPIAAGVAALGNWQDWDTGYLVTAARQIGGPWLEAGIFAAAAISAFVLLESTVLSSTRLPFTMAEDGFFHSGLARLHPRYRTPARAILLSTAFCAVLALFSLTQLIATYAWLRIASTVLTLLSFWRLRRKAPGMTRSFRVGGGDLGQAVVVLVPIALFLWALYHSETTATHWGLLALAAGPLAYYALLRTKRRDARAE